VLTEEALFELAGVTLGAGRAARCLELARLSPLTSRSWATSASAALIVGTRALGTDWWSTVHRELAVSWSTVHGESAGVEYWTARGTPAELLAARQDDFATRPGHSCLETLGDWVAEDAANAEWGMPIDFVDLNDPEPEDRIVLPVDAKPGDQLVAAWDPGGRAYVHVVERSGSPDPRAEKEGRRRGSIGSELGKIWHNDAANADWAWSMATDTRPIRLPGEIAGEPSDPFAAPLDPSVADRLRAWAARNGASADELGGAWYTKDDLWSARFRLGLPYSSPAEPQVPWLFEFDPAVRAAVDGDNAALVEALSRLEQIHRGL
jgi:hypothetical protein